MSSRKSGIIPARITTERQDMTPVQDTLLQTKLHIPQARPGLVARQRLLDHLQAGQQRKLTLISAPAGFGKTTLLSEWIASNAERQTLNDKDLIQRSAFVVRGSDEDS